MFEVNFKDPKTYNIRKHLDIVDWLVYFYLLQLFEFMTSLQLFAQLITCIKGFKVT